MYYVAGQNELNLHGLLLYSLDRSLLMNTRGAGEFILEHDFPLGTDTTDEIVSARKVPNRN